MKIALVAPLFVTVPPKKYGGTERVVSWINDELVGRGHDVTLFAAAGSQTAGKLFKVWPSELASQSTRLTQSAYILESELVREHAGEFDIIHSHVEHWLFPLVNGVGRPIVSTCHNPVDMPEMAQIYRKFRHVPLVSISYAQRAAFPWLNWQANVYHGLPFDLYRPGFQKGKYLVFLGRVSKEKGVVEAIEIARASSLELKIAGNVQPSAQEYFESCVKPLLGAGVEFVGELGDRDKNELLANAQALLFPISINESFGLVMIEALACGTPVIAFDRGSAKEVIDHGVTGFVCRSVQEAVASVADIDTISRRTCRQRFEERFTTTKMVDDYLCLFQRMSDVKSHHSVA